MKLKLLICCVASVLLAKGVLSTTTLVDFHEDNFTRGVFDNTTIDGTSIANVTLNNFTAEIRSENHDGNDVSLPRINTSGLVALLHFNNESEFNEGELDALSYDFSVEVNENRSGGRSNNVTCSGCPVFNASGKLGGTYEYDATVFFTFTDALSPGVGTDPFALTAWVYPDDMSGADATYGMGVIRSTTGDAIGNWMLSVGDTGEVQFYNWRSAGSDADGRHDTASGVVVDRVWQHIAAVYDGTNHKIYVNGVERTTSTATTANGWGTAHEVGRIFGAQYQWDGRIDEVAVWNRSLSGEEIKVLYERGGRYGIQTGNFTSQTFDAGSVANWTNLNWNSLLTSSENIVGTLHDNGDTTVIYTYNGSYITDPTNNLNEDKSITDFNTYTILSDFSNEDIVGFVDNSAADDVAVFFKNGSFIVDTTVSAWTSQIDFDDGVYAYTLPSGFNNSDILGFAYDLNADDAAIFFTNGSYVADIEVANLLSDIAFVNIHAYTIPADLSYENIIGFAVDDAANDVAVFFKNGSMLVDTSQSAYTSDMAFTDSYTAAYPSTVNTNKTGLNNLTLQTRVSNDSILFSNWSSVYTSKLEQSSNDVVLDARARYLQYQAVFSTEESEHTSILNNVSISFSSEIPEVDSTHTVPAYPRKDRNVTLVASVSGTNISSVNFTLTDPSGSVVVSGRNGSNNGVDTNWNFSSYNLTSFGTWTWNVTVISGNGLVVNSTNQDIILMEINGTLNVTAPDPNQSVYVSGHINVSNGTNVSNTRINLYLDETQLNLDQSVNHTTTADFSSGIFFNTSADNNNITLLPQNNATLKRAKVGNFTGTIDAGSGAVWTSITWHAHLKNTTDILGALYDHSASDLAVFQRNGSYNTDPSGNVQATKDIVNSRLYNLLSGFDYDDIIGFVDDDINAHMAVFFRNGSNLVDTSQGAPTGTIAFDDNQNAFTIPAGINISQAVDVIYDEDSSDLAMFLNNGSYIRDTSVTGFQDVSITFNGVRDYTIPSDFKHEDIVAFVSEDDLDDVAVIFKNGSIVVDTSQSTYNGDIDFTEYYTINFAPNTNTSAATNVTMQVRTSDDNIAYSDWSEFYVSVEGESTNKADIEVFGRYLQYNLQLKTPNPYEAPVVENVSLNFSAFATDSQGNYNVTFTAPSEPSTAKLKINTTWESIISGETIIGFIETASSCDCPSSGDFEISDGSNCSLSTVCDIGSSRLIVNNGALFIDAGGELHCGGVAVDQTNGRFAVNTESSPKGVLAVRT